MRSGTKVYTIAPTAEGWNATINARIVFSARSKAQVISLMRQAAQANSPSCVRVHGEDGNVETQWVYGQRADAKSPRTAAPVQL